MLSLKQCDTAPEKQTATCSLYYLQLGSFGAKVNSSTAQHNMCHDQTAFAFMVTLVELRNLVGGVYDHQCQAHNSLGCGSKLSHQGTAGFSLLFHLSSHFSYLILTHSHFLSGRAPPNQSTFGRIHRVVIGAQCLRRW